MKFCNNYVLKPALVMLASTTKYTLKSIPAFIAFAVLSLKSIAQANTAKGLITIKIRIRDLRTLTVWQSKEDMEKFRNSGFHAKAMVDSPKLGFNRFHSWKCDRIPTWSEAISKMEKAALN